MDAARRTADDAAERCPACGREVALEEVDSVGDMPCPRCRQLLWFLQKSRNGVLILTFLPGLMSGSEALGRVHEVHAAVANARRLVINLSQMRLVSSMFLGMLVAFYRRIAMEDGAVKLCGLNADTRDVFKATRLDRIFDIYGDEATALKSF